MGGATAPGGHKEILRGAATVSHSSATGSNRMFYGIWGWVVAHPLASPMLGGTEV
jgi:hypothetical protein